MAVYKRGASDGDVNHFPKKFVTLYSTGAVTAGDFVSIHTTDTTNAIGGTVLIAPAVGTNGCSAVVGIATETVLAADAPQNIVVQLAGKYDTANVHADTVAGIALCGPISVAGRADVTVAASFQNVAIALTDDSAVTNQAAVMIINQGVFD